MICLSPILVRERDRIERIISELGFDRFGVTGKAAFRFGRWERGIIFERDVPDTDPKKVVWYPCDCNASEFIRRQRPKNKWKLMDPARSASGAPFYVTAA